MDGQIAIRPVKVETVEITLVGKTPLICHAWQPKVPKKCLSCERYKIVGWCHMIPFPNGGCGYI